MKSFYLITYISSRKMALNFILMKQVCQRKIYFCCHLIFIVLNILVAILECDNVTVSLFEMGWHCNFAFFMNCQCCLCKKMCVCPCVRAYICMRMWKNCALHVGAWRGIFMFLCICVCVFAWEKYYMFLGVHITVHVVASMYECDWYLLSKWQPL